ncbi:MAG: hypothetical protein LBB49_03285 [Gracilibacteraceae bacterium]|nr:hypothetical protein [Gracilibacteraceae bacterium]
MVNINEVAGTVAKALTSNPDLLDRFKSHPHESIETISGISGLTAKDTGSILNVLLSGSDKGSGLLGSLADSLLSGKQTKSGDKNIIGDLITKAVGKKDSQGLMSAAISVILGHAVGGSSKSSSSKTSSSKSSSSKTSSKNSQKEQPSDLMGTLGNILGSLSDKNKK